MGQHSLTLMYGCKVDIDLSGESEVGDRLYYAAHDFHAASRCNGWGRAGCFIGFEIATGGSGRNGAAYLVESGIRFTEDAVATHEEYGPYLAAAVAAWPAFVAHVKARSGVNITGEPQLWLTNTETA